MVFKENWEKTQAIHNMSEKSILDMAEEFFDKKVESYEVISGGCANYNVKVKYEGVDDRYLLRIYLRHSEVGYVEKALADRLSNQVPLPRCHKVLQKTGNTFALFDFVPGVTLRDMLKDASIEEMNQIMFQVGELLGVVSSIEFDRDGFFDRNLEVVDEMYPSDMKKYILEWLESNSVKGALSKEKIEAIKGLAEKYEEEFSLQGKASLVHADFDPANILVKKLEGNWKVIAILDWEFAFAGPKMFDIANMLRYAHKMPDVFTASFIEGVQSKGVVLPVNYAYQVNLLNLFSLLDCLNRMELDKKPNAVKDIQCLISEILERL